MTRIAFSIGLLISITFDAVQLWLSRDNSIILSLGSIALFISIAALVAKLLDVSEGIELKWAVFYTIPAGLLVFGSLAGYESLGNTILGTYGVPPSPQAVPGSRADYTQSAKLHFLSLCIPFICIVSAHTASLLLRAARRDRG